MAVIPLDIYINDIGLCGFAQDRIVGSEPRTKEHGRPIRVLVHYYECGGTASKHGTYLHPGNQHWLLPAQLIKETADFHL